MLIHLDDWRQHNKQARETFENIGLARGIEKACHAINQCRDEKQAKGDGSKGYWEALFDMNAKLIELMREIER